MSIVGYKGGYITGNGFIKYTTNSGGVDIPLSVAGCSVWFDAKDVTTFFTNTNGTGNVTGSAIIKYWKNKGSSSSINVNWTSGINYTSGTYPYLSFNNTPSSSFSLNNVTNIFVIASYYTTPFGNFPGLLANGVGGHNYLYGNRTDTSIGSYNGKPPNILYNGNTTKFSDITTLNLYEIVGGTSSTDSQTFTNACIGMGDSGDKWNGQINEVLIYTSVVSTEDRQKIEGYLAWKWGIQYKLPNVHPYYSTAP